MRTRAPPTTHAHGFEGLKGRYMTYFEHVGFSDLFNGVLGGGMSTRRARRRRDVGRRAVAPRRPAATTLQVGLEPQRPPRPGFGVSKEVEGQGRGDGAICEGSGARPVMGRDMLLAVRRERAYARSVEPRRVGVVRAHEHLHVLPWSRGSSTAPMRGLSRHGARTRHAHRQRHAPAVSPTGSAAPTGEGGAGAEGGWVLGVIMCRSAAPIARAVRCATATTSSIALIDDGRGGAGT